MAGENEFREASAARRPKFIGIAAAQGVLIALDEDGGVWGFDGNGQAGAWRRWPDRRIGG